MTGWNLEFWAQCLPARGPTGKIPQMQFKNTKGFEFGFVAFEVELEVIRAARSHHSLQTIRA